MSALLHLILIHFVIQSVSSIHLFVSSISNQSTCPSALSEPASNNTTTHTLQHHGFCDHHPLQYKDLVNHNNQKRIFINLCHFSDFHSAYEFTNILNGDGRPPPLSRLSVVKYLLDLYCPQPTGNHSNEVLSELSLFHDVSKFLSAIQTWPKPPVLQEQVGHGDVLVGDSLRMFGGDMLVGSEYDIFEGSLAGKALEYWGIDVAVLGNHEFDQGWKFVDDIFSHNMNTAFVLSNVNIHHQVKTCTNTTSNKDNRTKLTREFRIKKAALLYNYRSTEPTTPNNHHHLHANPNQPSEPSSCWTPYRAPVCIVSTLTVDTVLYSRPPLSDITILSNYTNVIREAIDELCLKPLFDNGNRPFSSSMPNYSTATDMSGASIEKPCVIVLLSHLGHSVDVHLSRTIPWVDVILSSHSHTLLPSFPQFVTHSAVPPRPPLKYSSSDETVNSEQTLMGLQTSSLTCPVPSQSIISTSGMSGQYISVLRLAVDVTLPHTSSHCPLFPSKTAGTPTIRLCFEDSSMNLVSVDEFHRALVAQQTSLRQLSGCSMFTTINSDTTCNQTSPANSFGMDVSVRAPSESLYCLLIRHEKEGFFNSYQRRLYDKISHYFQPLGYLYASSSSSLAQCGKKHIGSCPQSDPTDLVQSSDYPTLLSHSQCRSGECSLGNFICDSLRYSLLSLVFDSVVDYHCYHHNISHTHTPTNVSLSHSVTPLAVLKRARSLVAFQNAGNFRSGLPLYPSPVRNIDIRQALPWDNVIHLHKLSPIEVCNAIAISVAALGSRSRYSTATTDCSCGCGQSARLLHVSGAYIRRRCRERDRTQSVISDHRTSPHQQYNCSAVDQYEELMVYLSVDSIDPPSNLIELQTDKFEPYATITPSGKILSAAGGRVDIYVGLDCLGIIVSSYNHSLPLYSLTSSPLDVDHEDSADTLSTAPSNQFSPLLRVDQHHQGGITATVSEVEITAVLCDWLASGGDGLFFINQPAPYIPPAVWKDVDTSIWSNATNSFTSRNGTMTSQSRTDQLHVNDIIERYVKSKEMIEVGVDGRLLLN
eukprot:GHVQ01015574.1.p1 GENE.GHVQ01015574.1~~GHVQ01015574.1.p1  ORF type:complete len:1041 (+),score=160.24 GHVQ01015574.1:382-3504(+)